MSSVATQIERTAGDADAPAERAFPFWVNDIPALHELRLPQCRLSSETSPLTIRHLFGCNTSDPNECWDYVLLSSYTTDLDWLLSTVRELSCVRTKVVVLSGEKGTATLRRVDGGRYAPTSDAMDRVNPFLAALAPSPASASTGAADLCRRWRLSRDRFAALEPPLPIAFGTHHTKMAVCVNRRGVRVCIFTANLVEQDWYWKSQGIYLQDFPWKAPSAGEVKSAAGEKAVDFERQLRHYWSCCGVDMTRPFTWGGAARHPLGIFNTDFLAHVDFTEAKVWLISSVPGTHAKGEVSAGYSVGLCRLAEVLRKATTTTNTATTLSEPAVLSWQYSSQGSLNPFFLNTLQAAMRGAPEAATADLTTPPPTVHDVQIIYPTEAEVRDSFEGWRGGGSLPVRLQNCHEFVNERLHRWGVGRPSTRGQNGRGVESRQDRPDLHGSVDSALDVDDEDNSQASPNAAPMDCSRSSRSRHYTPASYLASYRRFALPHIKSYAAVDEARTHLHWFVLTSANLSQAAWGSLGTKPPAKRTPQRLLVRSYELGVLYDATSAVDATSWFSVVAAPRIALPLQENSASVLFPVPCGTTCGAGPRSAPSTPRLYLPYDIRHPEPYASTAALRACRASTAPSCGLSRARSAPSTSPSSAAVPPQLVSCRDVPWVLDIPHRGADAYGRDIEEAFAAEYLPPLSRWQPAENDDVPRKRPRYA